MPSRRSFLEKSAHLCAGVIAPRQWRLKRQRDGCEAEVPLGRVGGFGESHASQFPLRLKGVRDCPWGGRGRFSGQDAQFTNPKLTAATMGWATKVLVI